MPKIIINEIDLTKASLQPAETDIAFVPGFTCLAKYPEDPTLCETVSDFEKNFGTYPAITGFYRRYVYNKDSQDNTYKKGESSGYIKYRVNDPDVFAKNFYKEIVKNTVYKSGVAAPYANGSLDGYTQVVLSISGTPAETDVTSWLNRCALMQDGDSSGTVSGANVNTSYFDLEYDMSYVYAKELVSAGIPVIYYVCKNISHVEDSVSDEVTITSETAGSTYTVDNKPIIDIDGITVNNATVTLASGTTPSAGEYTVDKETGVITFGTALVADDALIVNYTASMTSTEYSDMLSYIDSAFTDFVSNIDGIKDKGEYSIKYITSGAYPSLVFYKSGSGDEVEYHLEETGTSQFCGKLLNIAGYRGDAVSLIDLGDSTLFESKTDENKVRSYYEEQMLDPTYLGLASESEAFLGAISDYAEYGAIFAPWALYTTQAGYYVESGSTRTELPQLSSIVLPPSFGYLASLAKSIRYNNNWLAVAGVARGKVPYIQNLYTATRLSNSLADSYQPRNGKTSINSITNIKPYGLTIWGNRTAKNNLATAMGGEDGLTATSFLNVRNMVSDVKKTAYIAAKTLMFEQNSDVLWVNFLARVTPLLDKLKSGQGLSDYKVIKNPTTEKAKLKATIKLFPIYAVEEFEITIELSDEDVSVV